MPPYDDLIPGFANHTWQVHKFGGTSVADSNCFLRVATIIEQQLHDDNALVMDASKHHLAIVVSAMGGKPKVTDLLLRAVKYASLRDEEQVSGQLNVVLEKHRECLEELFGEEEEERERLMGVIEGGLEDIRDILKTVSLMKWEAERISGEKHNLLLMRIINAVQCIYVFIYIIFLCSQYHSLIQRSFLATVNCIPPKFLLLF
jgi:aspartokinase/homoserine dehydrogenase 1